MSIKHPKPRQVRLPFSVPRPTAGPSQPGRVCGMFVSPFCRSCGLADGYRCRKRDSRYTCPRCNVAYCSLECFQDEKHAQCSEPFYRAAVQGDIAADPRAAVEEKRAMLEMLRRFEEGAADGEDLLEDGLGEAEDDELAKALEGVDIDELDSNALFHLLPQAHRDKFLAALRDPESEETRALLRSAADDGDGATEAGTGEDGLPLPTELPWWEAADIPDADEEGEDEEDSKSVKYAASPEMLDSALVEGLSPPAGTGMRLAYNAIAICLAYLHTLLSFRLPSLAKTHLNSQQVTADELKAKLGRLVPFLVDARSTTRYVSARDAWGAVWEVIGSDPGNQELAEGEVTERLPTSLLIRLLTSIPSLLHPPLDTSLYPKALLLLSDLHGLFSRPKAGSAVPRKLIYYLAALQRLERKDWLALKREVEKEIAKLREESEETGEHLAKADPPTQNNSMLRIVG